MPSARAAARARRAPHGALRLTAWPAGRQNPQAGCERHTEKLVEAREALCRGGAFVLDLLRHPLPTERVEEADECPVSILCLLLLGQAEGLLVSHVARHDGEKLVEVDRSGTICVHRAELGENRIHLLQRRLRLQRSEALRLAKISYCRKLLRLLPPALQSSVLLSLLQHAPQRRDDLAELQEAVAILGSWFESSASSVSYQDREFYLVHMLETSTKVAQELRRKSRLADDLLTLSKGKREQA
eukprot:scaffold8253_cov267-Pinguiococcus_pyrenoidosus.AAC.8